MITVEGGLARQAVCDREDEDEYCLLRCALVEGIDSSFGASIRCWSYPVGDTGEGGEDGMSIVTHQWMNEGILYFLDSQ